MPQRQNGQRVFRFVPFGCRRQFPERVLLAILASPVIGLNLTVPAHAQAPASTVSQESTISGVVHDASGKGLGHVLVRLNSATALYAEIQTRDDGTFEFSNLPPGRYTIAAEQSGLHSPLVATAIPTHAAQQKIELVLATPVSSDAHPDFPTQAPATPAMEFSDTPNFTVAAVTDWTAAGGHGSDANLRTSEALNRDTARLRSSPPVMMPSSTSVPAEQYETTLRAAVSRAPEDFLANHNLGEFYFHSGKLAESIPPLDAASKIDPSQSQNAYDLATALCETGSVQRARELVKGLLARSENADLHRLAGEIDEKSGDPLSAVHEFEQAVHQAPTEQNYFAWGSELLLHRAVLQAKDVFSAGSKAYPESQRMHTALGAALFAGALYDDAARSLCAASDLDPSSTEPYLFMGKIELAAPNSLPCVEQKLARFVQLKPDDPQSNYYYAMTLWKQSGPAPDTQTLAHIESLLTKAATIDSHFSDAYLQLGVLKASEHDYQSAIVFYLKAIDANARSSQAHYRLAMAYDRVGDKDKAKQESQLHEDLEKQQAAEVDRQRREVKQFLVVDGKTPQGKQ